VLVVTQVAIATMLLVGASLLVHTFVKLLNVDPGYDGKNVLTFMLSVPPQMPGDRQLSVIEQVLAHLRADGRVSAAGYTNIAPFLSLTERGGLFVPPGATREEMLDDPLRPQMRIVSHDYLQTLGARLVAGRWLGPGDGASQPLAFVVNRALVDRYFGGSNGSNPIGTQVRVFRSREYVETWEIVGVIEDIAQARLDEERFPIVFADMRQVLTARAQMPKELQIGQGPSLSVSASRGRRWRATFAQRCAQSIRLSASTPSHRSKTCASDRWSGHGSTPHCSGRSPRLPASWPRSACTACSLTPSASARTRLACAWH
jgi:hypothetical protein